jgi:predicted RNA-binding protein with PIN domain
MYLVDGNNVMGGRVGWHRDKAGARRRLLDELIRFARARRQRVTVVFDGAPDPACPDGSKSGGVTVHYARRGADADGRIVELVEAEANRKNLLVVTSDSQLAARIRVCGVRVMRSGEFRQTLDAIAAQPPASADPSVETDEMKHWLRYFGVDEDDL